LLRAGSITRVMPAAAAATTFSLMPPTGSTRPRRLISPVIAVSLRTVRPVSSDTSAMNIATPALGPSFGVAPAGTCTWMSLVLEQGGIDAEDYRLVLHEAERRLRAFLHDVAELAGEDQLAVAGRARGLDEQDVAADRRPGEAGGHAGHAGAHRHVVLEADRAPAVPRCRPCRSDTLVAEPSATCTATWRSARPISRSSHFGRPPRAYSRR
jgi:hypothetical protein